jgi:flagellar biogenesis protein FliO
MKIPLLLLLIILPLYSEAYQNPEKKSSPDSLIFSHDNKTTSYSDSLKKALPEKKSQFGDYIFKAIWVSFVLLLFLFAGLFLYKKYVLKNSSLLQSRIKIVARQNISPKQSIIIANIEGKKFALGVSEHSVNVISDLGEAGAEDQLQANIPLQSGFAQVLNRLSKKK